MTAYIWRPPCTAVIMCPAEHADIFTTSYPLVLNDSSLFMGGGEGYGSARVPNFNEEASHCIKPPPDPPAMRVFVFEGRTHKFNTHKPLYESFTDFNDILS